MADVTCDIDRRRRCVIVVEKGLDGIMGITVLAKYRRRDALCEEWHGVFRGFEPSIMVAVGVDKAGR